MTNILKELKELDAKATSAPWKVLSIHGDEFVSAIPYKDHPYFGCTTTIEVMSDEEYPTKSTDAKLIAATRNALPDLIRAIELAEEALSQVNDKSYFVPAIVQDAISEIRKLKGE